MSSSPPDVPESVKIMAAIGHVCLQWSLLEMMLLAIIYSIEEMDVEKGEIIFGGLDIKPRVNMAIALAQHAKCPPPILKRLRAVRETIQKRLMDQRNQLVHGAHKNMTEGSTTLRMVRWPSGKKEKTFTALQIGEIGNAIHDASVECASINEAIVAWKLAPHRKKNFGNYIGD